MAYVFSPDWEDIERRHSNCFWNGIPVLDMATIRDSVADMMAAESEWNDAVADVQALCDQVIPPEETRYPGFLLGYPAHVADLFRLTNNSKFDLPNNLGPDDVRFHLTYGKSKRAPLAYMKRRAAEFRKGVKYLEAGVRKFRSAANNAKND